MRNENLNLNKIIDFKKWDNLQDYLSLVTKMAIVIVDYKGNPITKHSRCHKFCELVRGNSKLSKYCEKCDSRGGLEAVRMNKPYIYLCHYNIVDVAIPIIVDEKYIGAIMAGQVRIDDYESTDMLEQILKVPDKVLEQNDISNQLNQYYNELPVLSYKEVEDTSNMLFLLSNYIVEEALNKNLILEMYEKTMKNGIEIDSKTFNGYSIKNIESVKKEISNAIVNRYITYDHKEDSEEINVSKTLKPAIQYIYSNKSENISMEKMAKLCHVSPSYFSRLFSKEIGENFSTYISKLKIKWAKALLEETDMTINEISDELGFSESGYFIKIFKKYEGVTPNLYKKHLSNR